MWVLINFINNSSDFKFFSAINLNRKLRLSSMNNPEPMQNLLDLIKRLQSSISVPRSSVHSMWADATEQPLNIIIAVVFSLDIFVSNSLYNLMKWPRQFPGVQMTSCKHTVFFLPKPSWLHLNDHFLIWP